MSQTITRVTQTREDGNHELGLNSSTRLLGIFFESWSTVQILKGVKGDDTTISTFDTEP